LGKHLINDVDALLATVIGIGIGIGIGIALLAIALLAITAIATAIAMELGLATVLAAIVIAVVGLPVVIIPDFFIEITRRFGCRRNYYRRRRCAGFSCRE
jgi:heme/copper-type cytochrome/quinol oxidase subunit 1